MSSRPPAAFDDLGFSPILGASVTYQQGERARAVRYLAATAADAADLTLLCDVLDLDPKEGKQ